MIDNSSRELPQGTKRSCPRGVVAALIDSMPEGVSAETLYDMGYRDTASFVDHHGGVVDGSLVEVTAPHLDIRPSVGAAAQERTHSSLEALTRRIEELREAPPADTTRSTHYFDCTAADRQGTYPGT